MLNRILLVSLFPVFVFCASRPLFNDTKFAIREYDVPTPNSRPHDPAVAPDGALWYTGQLANKLGRLDPNLVHREFQGLHWQARSPLRQHNGISNA